MTRAQQQAERILHAAQADYLTAYGWCRDGGRWKHPKLQGPMAGVLFTADDAVIETRTNTLLRLACAS